MAGTERWGQLSGSLVLLLVLTAAVAAPASAASDGTSPSLAGAPPAAFAERIANRPGPGASETSILAAIELIVLAAACAVGVAYYSAARERYDAVRSRRLTRRR